MCIGMRMGNDFVYCILSLSGINFRESNTFKFELVMPQLNKLEMYLYFY